jgi:protease-4
VVKKAFLGLWNVLNFSRRLFLNILFLIIIIALIVSVMSSDDELVIEQDSALVLSIAGNIVEEKAFVDPVQVALNDSKWSR